MKNSTCFFRRNFLLLSTIFVFATINDLLAQTTWTGSVSTAWNTAGNWSAGVPDATDDVTIPNVTNDPVISVAGAVAKSVAVQAGGLLSINAAGTLAINGSVGNGIFNEGTVQNNGTIYIGNTTAIGGSGIYNKTAFNNNSGAIITIDRAGTGIYNDYGNFTNAGTLTMGAVAGGGKGFDNWHGSFNNNAGGVTSISNAASAIYAIYGSITNGGTINIGPAGSATMAEGMLLSYISFANNAGGQININRVNKAITFYGDNIANAGTFSIGAETTVNVLFDMFSTADGIFSNNTGGVFKASGTLRAAEFINAGGTVAPGNPLGQLTFNASENFTNNIMGIDVNGTGTAGVHYDRVVVNGTATLGGTLALSINYAGAPGDQITILSANAILGTFSSVTGLPANWQVNYTPVSVILSYQPIPPNTWTGNVNTSWNNAGNWSAGVVPLATDEVIIPDVTNNPEITTNTAVAKSVKVLNGGILTIAATGVLSVNGGSTYGVWNKGSLINWGKVRIGNSSNVGIFGIYNENIIQNFLGCFLEIDRASSTGIAMMAGTMNNAGTIIFGSTVPVPNLVTGETGTISNNGSGTIIGTGNLDSKIITNNGGTLSPGYPLGKMTFYGDETFANSTLAIEINGVGVAGTTYDQVAVSGAATLGGTLNLSINYAGAVPDQFTILAASSISGTFSTINGLPAGWSIAYYPTGVLIIKGLAASTWTGAVSTAWNTAGNWSAGVPQPETQVTIPNVTNDPIISTAGILVKSITVQSGGLLTVSAAGVLHINGSVGNGIFNEGTVQNNGTIYIGNTTALGGSGIYNKTAFNNNSGAIITIDRAGTGIYNDYGNFTNAGTLTIGAAAGGGKGFENWHGSFNNNAGGVTSISNAASAIYAIYGSITNGGTINIGPAGSATMAEGMLLSYISFANNAGGQININRVNKAITFYGDNIANAGTFSIGAETAVNVLFDMFSTADGIFSNNTGGVFKASGTLRAAEFINAGGTVAPGHPLGKLTFNASEDFTNNIMSMDVNGVGTAGINYDQVVVNGTVTLGGTLALSINYAGVQGNQVTLISAAAISGTFSSVTGLLPNWKLSYTATSVLLTYDANTTWTGAISSAWNTPGNWTNGVPTASSMVTIPNVTIDPVISVAGANALTVHVQAGAILSIMNTGSLTTHGVATFNAVTTGLYNQGTVHNSGILTIHKQ
jgi:hypothetical protein